MKNREVLILIIALINCACAVVCAALAGCRMSLGKFQIEDLNGELFTTNTITIVER